MVLVFSDELLNCFVRHLIPITTVEMFVSNHASVDQCIELADIGFGDLALRFFDRPCPRLQCRGMPLPPYGDSENLSAASSRTTNPVAVAGVGTISSIGDPSLVAAMDSRVKRFCASCGEVFYLWDSQVDGCAFGPSFCHLFMMVCGEEVFGTLRPPPPPPPQGLSHERRIYGFRLHPSTRMGHSVQHTSSTLSV